jgi:hypothetical protein
VRWAAERAGLPGVDAGRVGFEATRQARLDTIADTLEASLDTERLVAMISGASPVASRR